MYFQVLNSIAESLKENHSTAFRKKILKGALERILKSKRPSVKALNRLTSRVGNESTQITVLNSVFSVLTHTCRLGRSDQLDVEPVQILLESGFRLHGERALGVLRIINSLRGNAEIEQSVKRLAKYSTPEANFELLDCMLYVSRFLGEPDSLQHEFIKQTAIELGFKAVAIKEINKRYEKLDEYEKLLESLYSSEVSGSANVSEEIRSKRDPLRAAFKVLGLEFNTPNKEIKDHYKKIIYEQHPDRLVAQGISGKALEKARTDFESLLAAYEFIRKERNFR